VKIFRCQCTWVWVIGNKKVAGPFYNNATNDQSKGIISGRITSFKQWALENGDCAHAYDSVKDTL
jgi:hypothetical protein